jgi:hypothetical protein
LQIEIQTLIGAVSALIAAGSALVAWQSSSHSKRNADKALGDVEPFIEMFQLESTFYGGKIPRVAVAITNYNRRAMLLHRIEFETNDGYIAYRVSDQDDRMALAGIVSAIVQGDREPDDMVHYRYDPPLRLPGNRSLGANPPQYDFVFDVTPRDNSEQWETIVGINVEYILDGDDKKVFRRFERKIIKNGVKEFSERFRSLPAVMPIESAR